MFSFSLRGSLGKLRQDMTPVVIVAVREWRTSVQSRVFLGISAIYPLVLSLMLWVFLLVYQIDKMWIEKWMGDYGGPELIPNFEEILGVNIPPVPITYAVVDNSNSQIGESIRNEILKRDVARIVEYIRGRGVSVFSTLLPSIDAVEQKTKLLRETMQTEAGKPQGVDSYLSVLVDAINSLEQGAGDAIDDDDAKSFASWWTANIEYWRHAIPNISSRYFSESIQDNTALVQLDELLALQELNGYFVLPEGFPDTNSTIEYVTSELTDSIERRSVFLLRHWYEEIATGVLANLINELEETDDVRNSLPVITTAINSPIKPGEDVSSRSVSFDSDDEPRYLTLWVRSIWNALFWVAMFYSVYSMSFNTTEEKQSRIAEVLLSSVSHMNLMDGKVIGNALIVLTVLGSWAVILGAPIVCLIALAPELESYAVGELFNPIYILNWFVCLSLGIMMLGYLLTALGALFSTDQVMSTTLLVLVALFSIGLLTSLDPTSTLASLVRFVPPVTPFAMVSQTTSLPTWPIYFVLVALVITFLCVIRSFLVRLFARGMLLDAVPRKFGSLVKTLSAPQ